MVTPTSDRDTILKAIRTWPLEDQVALAKTILQRASSRAAMAPQRPDWRQMAGLALN